MDPGRTSTRVAVGVAFILFCPRPGLSMSFKVAPVRVFLDASKKTATLKVTNESDHTLSLQLNTVTWSQDGAAKDVEQPTNDIIYHPRLFTLPQGQERLVRIGLANPKQEGQERTYRIYIRELPDKSKTAGTGFRTIRSPRSPRIITASSGSAPRRA